MNVRKRGLALLMCICMIFTLLPFSALADATTQVGDIAYGKYGDDGWSVDDTLTAPAEKEYTNSDTGADVKYSKTAAKNDDGSYTVTLKIKSTTSKTAPGASAVVLVIDSSRSMEGGRLEKALDAAKSFAESYGATAKSGRYIAAVEFSNKASSLNFGTYTNPNYWLDVANADNLRTFKNGIADWLYANGGTDLAYGLRMTGKRFDDNTVKNISNRYAVVLTDGKPDSLYDADPEKTATDAAKQLRNKAEIYTVGVGLNDYTKYFLENSIASKADGKTYAYNVSDSDDLNKTFSTIFKEIDKGISSGFTVTDPMSDYVTLNESSITGNGASVKNGTITWTPTSGETVTNENGSKTTTYTLTYKVTLKDKDVDTDDYYPLNKDTTLTFTDGKKADGSDNNVTLQFNVPGVYREAPKYTVTYEYDGDVPEGAPPVPTDTNGYKAGDIVTVKPAPTLDGYNFSGWTTTGVTVEDGEFTMPGDNVVFKGTWTAKNDLLYTVHHYWNGTTESVYPDEVENGQTFNTTVTVNPKAADDNYTPVSTDPKTVTITTGKNEVTFYYYKNVTLKANNSLDNVYDGTEKTVSSFTGAPDGADFSAIKVGANGTDAGTYKAEFAKGTVGTVDATEKYIVVKAENGKLEIARANVTVKAKDYEIAVGSALPTPEADVSGLFGTDTVVYTINGMPENSNTAGDYTLTPTGNAIQGNYNVTYETGTLTIYQTYKVEYKYVCTDGSDAAESLTPPATKSYRAGTTVTVENEPEATALDGYTFVGWYKDGKKIDAEATFDIAADTEIIGKWEPVTGLSYVVHYYWAGTTDKVADDKIVDGQTFGTVIKSETPIEVTNYKAVPDQVSNLTISTENEKNVITFYYYKNIELTANSGEAKYDGTLKTADGFKAIVAADNDADIYESLKEVLAAHGQGTDAGRYDVYFTKGGEIIPATDLVGRVLNDRYWVTKAEQGKLTISPRSLTITSGSDSKYYDGTPLTNDKITVTGDGFVNGEGATYNVTGSQTKIGSSDNTFEVIFNANTKAANYVVEKELGTLTIKARPVNPGIYTEIIVEITGNSDSVVYDGTEHSVKGYTVKISDPRYTEKDFTFTGKAEASGVNAGTYEMGLKAEQFRNTNALFRNVKFVIKADGILTITPKDLTITAGSKTEYGPTPVTCDEWTVSGLVAGDKVESVKITGIQSVPGSSPNVPSDAVIKNAKGEDVTKNYAIKYVNGTLTMLEVLNKEDHFNYIIGTPEGLSLPTANVTRAEVATIFFRLMTDDARAKFDSLDNSFSDVAKGKWYNRAISTLAKAGIIKGDPAGTYRPGDPITRAEMAAIIARFGDFKEGGKTFSDISGHWAQKYIELAASNGWINGNPDGTFKPNNNITRAETVAMINRVLNRQTESNDDLLPVSQMTNWSDNMDTAKWYYRDMQEATNNHKAERVGDSMYEKWTEKLPDIDWASYQI